MHFPSIHFFVKWVLKCSILWNDITVTSKWPHDLTFNVYKEVKVEVMSTKKICQGCTNLWTQN